MSRLGDRRHRHDPFHQKAKKEGFAARAVYKLQEIDEKHRLFRPGQTVLDLGCRPGSWLQYARRKVGDRLVFGRSGDIDALEAVTWASYAAEVSAYDVLDSIY